jgi:uncharacterized protein (TIGR03437 family)
MRKLIVRMMSGLVLFGFITLLVGRLDNPLSLGSETVSAQTVIQLVPVVTSGLDSPLYVTNARDSSNRLFIVEQSGRILVLPPGATSPLPTPFLDIRSKTLLDRERGLLGMAFHTQYPSNGRFFVNYIRTGDGDTVISEFKVSASNPNIAETTEKILLTIDQPGAEHMGGMVEFGPDGFLYIGMGDGGCCNDPDNRAQNIEELLGKMLRIDVDNTNGTLPYSSPSTNPFFGPIPGRDEIFATGLRNPFRWSFDRTTGQLYAGDVGELDIEEIDIITLGGNYGWRVFEGARCTENDPNLCDPNVFIPPITEYDHSGGRCSVIGGYVYRGTRSSLPVGSYVFGDFCTGEIFILQNDTVSLLLDTDMALASFGEDESGEIYVVDLRGRIFRIAAPSVATTVSAASYSGDSVATESIVSAFGSNFSTTTQSAPSGQELPTTLAGASISVRDAAGTERFAPLFFVSPMQINYQIPPGTVSGNAIITITNTSLFGVASGTANITDIAPGLFTANANGVGVAAAVALRIRADDSQVFEPVAIFDQTQNQFVAIPIDLGLETDQVFLVPFGAGFRFRSSSSAVTATVGGTDVQVTFAGAQGTLIGLDQANIRLPRSLIGRGEVDVVMTVDGQTTNTVRISIK